MLLVFLHRIASFRSRDMVGAGMEKPLQVHGVNEIKALMWGCPATLVLSFPRDCKGPLFLLLEDLAFFLFFHLLQGYKVH